MSSTLSRLKREGGISLEMLQRRGASSRIEGENLLGFLELRQETWVSSRVVLVFQGTLGVA